MDRRTFLGGSGLVALVGVAGCICGYSASATGDDETTTTAGTTPAPETTTSDPTPARTPTGTTPGEDPSTTTPGDPASTPTQTPTPTPTPTPTETPPPSSVSVQVGGDLTRFSPQAFELARGGTVEWVWAGSGHNVVPDSQPPDADWSGTPGAPDRTYDSGYAYSYTFEVPGEYGYHCSVHDQYGMVGSFAVV